MLLGEGVRRLYILLAGLAAVGACTPEAVEVEPSGGAAGEEATASGGKGGNTGGSSGGGSCAPIASPTPSCTECIPQQCPTEASACEGNACTCGDYGGYQGQINCMLACATLSPMITAANACASQCGFGSLGGSDLAAHALFDCLVNPPKGPPACPDCFPVH
jgi:hypothetical protein